MPLHSVTLFTSRAAEPARHSAGDAFQQVAEHCGGTRIELGRGLALTERLTQRLLDPPRHGSEILAVFQQQSRARIARQ